MNLVIDTNVMLVSVGNLSPTHKIIRSLVDEEHSLCITTSIINEYEEIFSNKLGYTFASMFIDLILNLPKTKLIVPYFDWNLITQDPDDNKFVDCAIAANAEYIVTEDKHFEILKTIDFPIVNIITSKEFIEQYLN